MLRRAFLIGLLALLAAPLAPSHARAQGKDDSFAAFVNALWPDARAKGITRATFDAAMRGVTPDQRVINATRRQPEYGKPVGDYIAALASPRRIQNGLTKAKEWSRALEGVDKLDGSSEEHYALCRCGGSKNKPFCDATVPKTSTLQTRAERPCLAVLPISC